MFSRALAGLSIPAVAERSIIASIQVEFLKPDAWRVFDCVQSVLDALTTAEWKHVIISNHVPELPTLDTVLCSAQIGIEKPDPRFLEYVLAFSESYETACAIGDSASGALRERGPPACPRSWLALR